jgi:2-polyprenyl-6-methoxyphenol hydroxylase-like FAD-dependent oxidoreductase
VHYTSVTVVDGACISPWTSRIQNTPGRTLLLNSSDTTTDIVLVFHSDAEITYDYHDRFAHAGAPFSDAVIDTAVGADNFYFDELGQNRSPQWSSGQVALVGDAAYCPSPPAEWAARSPSWTRPPLRLRWSKRGT